MSQKFADLSFNIPITENIDCSPSSHLFKLLQNKFREQSKQTLIEHDNIQIILIQIRKIGKKNPCKNLYIPQIVLNSKFLAIQLVKYWHDYLKNFRKFNDDRDVVLAAVSKSGSCLQYLPRNHPFLDDFEIAFQAVKTNASSFQYLSENMKLDRRIVLRATKSGLFYKKLPNQFKKDREIMIIMMKNFPKYAYQDLNNFLDDKGMVVRACRYNTQFIEKLSERLRNNVNFIEKCTKVNPKSFSHFPKKFSDDFEIVKRFAKSHLPLTEIPEQWRTNLEIVQCCLMRNPYDIMNVPNSVRMNVEFMIEMVTKNNSIGNWIFSNLPKDVVYDREFIEKIISLCPRSYSTLPDELKDIELTRMAISKSKPNCILNYIPNSLLGNRELVLESLSGVKYGITSLPEMYKKDREVIIMALNVTDSLLTYLNIYDFVSYGIGIPFLRELVTLFPVLHNNSTIEYLKKKPSWYQDYSIEKSVESEVLESNVETNSSPYETDNNTNSCSSSNSSTLNLHQDNENTNISLNMDRSIEDPSNSRDIVETSTTPRICESESLSKENSFISIHKISIVTGVISFLVYCLFFFNKS